MTSFQLAAVLAAVVLLASVLSVELGITVALLELTLGVVAGNLFHLQTQEWLDFIAKFASIVLTFLAGMEVDPGVHAPPTWRIGRDRRCLFRRAVRRRVNGRLSLTRLEHAARP